MSESNSDGLSLHLQGAQAIRQAVDAARGFGTRHRLIGGQLTRLCIVVEELVANLYDHGGVTEQDVVDLAMALDPRGIRVAITDPGIPFDPWSVASTSERRGGGAGLSLIRTWAEPISYRSTAIGNHLELMLPVSWPD